MKKRYIAKFAVLAMVLLLLPASVWAASQPGSTYGGRVYEIEDDSTYAPREDTEAPSRTSSSDRSEPSYSDSTSKSVVAIGEVVSSGDGVGTTIEVEDSTAPVTVSATALDSMMKQAGEGDSVSVTVMTTGAVSVPNGKLVEMVEKTGKSVTIGNSVASLSINKELLETVGGALIKFEPVVKEDGTIELVIRSGGKKISPAKVPGGIDFEIPAPNRSVSEVIAVRKAGADVKLDWTMVNGNVKFNLSYPADIKLS